MCASIAEFDMRSEPRNSGSFRPTTSSAAIPRAARSEPKIAVQRRSASVVQTTPGNASRSVRNDSSAEEDSGPFGSGDAIGGGSTPLRRAEGQASLTKARGRRPIDIGPDIPWARGGAAKGAEMTESVGRSAWHGIEVRHLAALQALAEEASFHGAARRLGYSQPAVSQQLAALERIVGTQLVNRPRVSQPLTLTESGERLLVVPRNGRRAARHESIRPAELRGVKLIAFKSSGSTQRVIDHLRADGIEPQFALRSDDNNVVQGFVAAGFGAALIPRLAAELLSGSLDVISFEPALPPRIVGLAWTRDLTASPCLQTFVAATRRIAGRIWRDRAVGAQSEAAGEASLHLQTPR